MSIIANDAVTREYLQAIRSEIYRVRATVLQLNLEVDLDALAEDILADACIDDDALFLDYRGTPVTMHQALKDCIEYGIPAPAKIMARVKELAEESLNKD